MLWLLKKSTFVFPQLEKSTAKSLTHEKVLVLAEPLRLSLSQYILQKVKINRDSTSTPSSLSRCWRGVNNDRRKGRGGGEAGGTLDFSVPCFNPGFLEVALLEIIRFESEGSGIVSGLRILGSIPFTRWFRC